MISPPRCVVALAERSEQARTYARQRLCLALLELALGLLYLLLWIGSGLASWVRDLLPPEQPLRVALMFLSLAGGYGLLTLPLSFYGGFVLSHRYGLSLQSLRGWAWDLGKAAGISALLGLVMIEVLYGLLGAFPQWWWVWGALFLLLLTVVLSTLAPLILVPLFFRMRPLADEALVARLAVLARRVGTPVRGVYTLELSAKTRATNAALMGLGRTRRIVLGDSLLREYTAEEIEAVAAHELAHQRHADIPKGLLFQGAMTLVALGLAGQFLQRVLPALGSTALDDVAAMPALALVLSGVFLILAPLQRAYSRDREAAADRSALRATQNPAAFISMITKLADQNLAEHQPPRWVELLFYDHPSPAKRTAAAQSLLLATEDKL